MIVRTRRGNMRVTCSGFPATHAFLPDEDGVCRQCPLPRHNAVHTAPTPNLFEPTEELVHP